MMSADLFKSYQTAAFPDRSETNPARKTAAWIAQFARAGVAEFARARGGQYSYQYWAHDPDIADNIRYATGTQDTQQYRRFSGVKVLDHNSVQVTNRDGVFDEATSKVTRHSGSSGPQDPTDLDSIINAPPLPVLPVKLQALAALITQNYETTITALGKKARGERAEHEGEVRLWMDFGDALQQQGIPMPEGMPSPLPQNEAELQDYLTNWQVGAAADLELKIQIADVESDIDQLMSEVADDVLTHGYGGLFDRYQQGKRTVTHRILPDRGIFLPTRFPDYRDLDMGGVFEMVDLATIKAEIRDNRATCNAQGKNWKKEDWARLADKAAQSLPKGTDLSDTSLGDPTSSGSTWVIRYYFRTDDEWTPKGKDADQSDARVDENGNLLINSLYEATLVCGTDLAYNCRKVKDQARDLHNPLKARLPFALYATPSTGGKPTSIVRRVKGIVNEMERSWRAYMADMRTYIPEGYNVQLRALQTMAEGMKLKGDNAIMQAYEFFRRTGDTFADLVNEDKEQVGTATQKNPTGIPLSAQQHLQNLLQQLNLLEAMTGANAVVSAATPNDGQGKGVSQIALQGAANVMAFARTGLQKVYEAHAKNLAGRIWATDAIIPTTGTVPGPEGGMREVGKREDFHEYQFHMRVDIGPSKEEWTELYARAAAASENGQITVADEVHIKELRNLKTARRYLAVATQKKARQAQQDSLALQKANADSQTQTGQAVEAARQQTLQMQHGLELQRLEYARGTAWGTVDRQTAAQLQVAQGNNAAKVKAAHIAEMGHAARTDADNDSAERLAVMGHTHDNGQMVLSSMLPQPAPVG